MFNIVFSTILFIIWDAQNMRNVAIRYILQDRPFRKKCKTNSQNTTKNLPKPTNINEQSKLKNNTEINSNSKTKTHFKTTSNENLKIGFNMLFIDWSKHSRMDDVQTCCEFFS